MSEPAKKPLAFSFGKTKPKVNLIQTEVVKVFTPKADIQNGDNIELITGLEGKIVKSINPVDKVKKPLVIPCLKNDLNFGKVSAEDLEVLNALKADATGIHKKEADANLTIPADKIDPKLKAIEEPDYEEVGIESFGLAALRGMGWSEKKGVGLNKRRVDVIEVECRPRGLGLGAGPSKKKKTEEEKASEESESHRYTKGAYIQVTNGKNEGQYGKICSFGDGLDRIIVELNGIDEKFSVLQVCTRLVTRQEYKKATEKAYRR